MTDLIDRDALIHEIKSHDFKHGWDEFEQGVLSAMDDIETIINGAESIEAVPVVHGRWVENKKGYLECSVCHTDRIGIPLAQRMRYCFGCGAKMDGEESAE